MLPRSHQGRKRQSPDPNPDGPAPNPKPLTGQLCSIRRKGPRACFPATPRHGGRATDRRLQETQPKVFFKESDEAKPNVSEGDRGHFPKIALIFVPARAWGQALLRGLLQGKPAWTLVLVPEKKIQNKVTSTEQVPTPLSRECRSAAVTDGQLEGRVVPTVCREGFLCGQLWGRAQQLYPGPSRLWRQRPSLGHRTIQRPPSVSPPLRHYLGWDGGSVRCGLQGPEA